MPFLIKRLHHSNKYRVTNKQNGTIHSYATSLLKAQRQVRLIGAVDHGFRLKKSKRKNIVVV